MLGALGEIENDDALKMDLIIKILERKWLNYGQKFYLYQFSMFVTLLFSMIVFFSTYNDIILIGSGSIFALLAVYFLLYEGV